MKTAERWTNQWLVGLILVGCGLLSCGIQFRQASLYDGIDATPAPPKPEKIALAVEPVIFDDDGTNFWVSDDPNCTTGSVERDIVFSGTSALKINWNRDPAICEWAGFGIGWDDWTGKDLTDVYPYAAIQMHVRTQEGKMFGLPIVLTLEDYSGNMAWSYTVNKYFERYSIDEEWQKVIVPLNTFDLSEDGLDIGNVKQLMFELQQAGGIYLDDIRLIYYTPEPTEPWLVESERSNPLAFPIQLFGDHFINDNGWGLFSDHCQTLELTNSGACEGKKAIHAQWDMSKKDCYVVALGVSWNHWYPVDMTSVASTTTIECEVNFSSMPLPKVQIGFEDYERLQTSVLLSKAYLSESACGNGWQHLRIPLTDLKGPGSLANIKQFVIYMEESGDLYLDNLRLVRDDM